MVCLKNSLDVTTLYPVIIRTSKTCGFSIFLEHGDFAANIDLDSFVPPLILGFIRREVVHNQEKIKI